MKGWSRERDEDDQAAAATRTLLLQLGFGSLPAALDRELTESPQYPSLTSIVELLEGVGMEVDGFEGAADALGELPTPYIATSTDGRLIVVTRFEAGTSVDFIDTRRGPRRVRWDEFVELYDDYVLAARPALENLATKHRRERDSNSHIVTASVSLGIGAVAALALLGRGLPGLLTTAAPLLVLDAIGLGLSWTLFKMHAGRVGFAQQFCGRSARSDCDAVTSSPAGKIGSIPMSDVGIVYFAGALVCVLAALASGGAIWVATLRFLGLVALLAIPYTIFSIGYQRLELRTWCPLCLGVHGVLVAEALLTVRLVPDAWPVAPEALAPALIGFLVVPVWTIARTTVEQGLKFPAADAQRARLAQNPAVIAAALAQVHVEELPEAPLEIRTGSPSAPVVITVYTEPNCPQCASAHTDLTTLMERLPGALQIRYRMLDWSEDDLTRRLIVGLATAVVDDNMDVAARLLRDWSVATSRRTTLALETPIETDDPEVRTLIEAHDAWCADPPIHGTPTVFLDGKRVPTHIKPSSLRLYIAARAARHHDRAA